VQSEREVNLYWKPKSTCIVHCTFTFNNMEMKERKRTNQKFKRFQKENNTKLSGVNLIKLDSRSKTIINQSLYEIKTKKRSR
jgi:hypothetical protein